MQNYIIFTEKHFANKSIILFLTIFNIWVVQASYFISKNYVQSLYPALYIQ